MHEHPVDGSGPDVTPVEPLAETLAEDGVLDDDVAHESTPTGIPPVPGPPPGIPDEDWPGEGRPPINLGVMDPG